MNNIYWTIREEGEEYRIFKSLDDVNGEMTEEEDQGIELTLQDVVFVVLTDDDMAMVESSTDELIAQLSRQLNEQGEAMLMFPAREKS